MYARPYMQRIGVNVHKSCVDMMSDKLRLRVNQLSMCANVPLIFLTVYVCVIDVLIHKLRNAPNDEFRSNVNNQCIV